jgi:hypothetical protein
MATRKSLNPADNMASMLHSPRSGGTAKLQWNWVNQLAQQAARIGPCALAHIWQFQRNVRLIGKLAAAKGRLARLPRPGHRDDRLAAGPAGKNSGDLAKNRSHGKVLAALMQIFNRIENLHSRGELGRSDLKNPPAKQWVWTLTLIWTRGNRHQLGHSLGLGIRRADLLGDSCGHRPCLLRRGPGALAGVVSLGGLVAGPQIAVVCVIARHF